MATLLLAAAGAAIGSGFGGTVLGLSGAVIGRAVGATVGRVIDQKILGGGSQAIETGRVERFRIMGAGEGAPIGRLWGRTRVAGQVIWASRFAESETTEGGGKGSRPRVTSFSYAVSLAVALCEGPITGVGRIWADGQEIDPSTLNMRVYLGREDQQPDPRIAAVEGLADAPAYRGIAYVVIEDMALAPFGNRVPALSFEVTRRAAPSAERDLADCLRAVALIPGTGEYSLATRRVYMGAEGEGAWANVAGPYGGTDFTQSLRQLQQEAPNCGAVSLIVSWFGDDLRCGSCSVRPKVEQTGVDGTEMAWRAGGIDRTQAMAVARLDDRPVYGGTPADAAIVESIRAMSEIGKAVMFYPFVLMEQLPGNSLPNPYTGSAGQPALPWRGRITTSLAPGLPGSTDRSAAAAAEVATFFGAAQASDFSVVDGEVRYAGPEDWGYRRFILHYAHLCALAGGVESFCVGSELVALTQIRGAGDSFPAVAQLIQLVGDVRAILGPQVRISYAADWSEYFGYHRDGNVYFHLDPLWAHPQVNFIGIDNYMPLSDWREGEDQADAAFGSIYNLDYLTANVAGGEGFDWFYDSAEGEAAQRRTPITDGAFDEPWVFRYKDLRAWWSHPHFNRIDGIRSGVSTAWVPRSKPFWFTEYGCAAIDRGTNQPNKFLDPKSSESFLPKHSTGARDDLIQHQYYAAIDAHFGDTQNNPVSGVYGGPMLDLGRCFAWAWDARPFPAFPQRSDLWSDAANYARGHWLNGRATSVPLPRLVQELCGDTGPLETAGLYGLVRGFELPAPGSARAALQPLMLAYGAEAAERGGRLVFATRDGRADAVLEEDALVLDADAAASVTHAREAEGLSTGAVRTVFREAEGDYATRETEARLPGAMPVSVVTSDLPLVLTGGEGRAIAARWLAEAQVAQDTVTLSLPPSLSHLGTGDVVVLGQARYRIDRVTRADAVAIEGLRVEPGIYRAPPFAEDRPAAIRFAAPSAVTAVLLDLPLLTGDEAPHAPWIAAAARPWPGLVGVWLSDGDEGYQLNTSLARQARIGRTETALAAARPGLWDRGPVLRIRLSGKGVLATATEAAVLAGANALAIGDGSPDLWEILQFRDAVLVAPQTYEVSFRLRGQGGSDGVMPSQWPVGSRVVILDDAPTQLRLPSRSRGVRKSIRIGALVRGVDDPAVVTRSHAFKGNGLRPYPVAHLKAQADAAGSLDIAWVRRTRIDGDDWDRPDVPLGEESESYLVRVRSGTSIVRTIAVAQPAWTYTSALRAADGTTGAFQVEVAQVSARYGTGPFRSLFIAG
jgi:hypothetical protein